MPKYKAVIVGTADLLMNRLDEKEVIRKPGRRVQTQDPESWKQRVHYDEKNKRLFLPAMNIEMAMIAIAKGMRAGKQYFGMPFRSGVFVHPDRVPFEGIKGNLEDMPNNGACYVHFSAPANDQGQRPPLWRLALRAGWKMAFEIEVLAPEVQGSLLQEVLEVCGRRNGLGSWRPRYGRFTVESFA